MKANLGWIIKLTVTLGLFVLIFAELGEEYLPLSPDGLAAANEELFMRGGKSMFGLRGKAPVPVKSGEICQLKGQKIRVRTASGLKPVDTDILCKEAELTVFVQEGGKFQEILITQAAGRPIFLKTKGWWRVAPISIADLWKEIKSLNTATFWFWIGFAFLMKLGGVFSSLMRWTVLLRGQGINLPFQYLIGTFFTGRFFGMFTPGTLGLDGYRLYDSIRQTRKPIECTAVIVVEKLIGFVALFGLLFITLPMGMSVIRSKGLPMNTMTFALILLVFGSIIGFVLLLLFWPWLVNTLFRLPLPFKKRFQVKLDEILRSTTAYANKRFLLLQAIFLGFLVHAGTVLMYVGTARAITTPEVKLMDIFFAAPLMITGTVFGPSMGGEGIRELVFVFLLGAKTTAAKAFLLGHLGFWVGEFLISVPGALVYALRPAGYKAKLTRADLEQVKTKA